MVAGKRTEAGEVLKWNSPCHGDQPARYVSDILLPQSHEAFHEHYTTIIQKLQDAGTLIETLKNKYVSTKLLDHVDSIIYHLSIIYIIDRLWKAGLLLKNDRKYPAVYDWNRLD